MTSINRFIRQAKPFRLLLCFLVASPLSAGADVLLGYTFSGGFPNNFGPGVPVTYASSFTVGSQDVQVTSIDFRLASAGSPSSADTTAYIFSDTGNQPGVLIGSSHRSFAQNEMALGLQFYDYSFASPLALTAGTSYWAAFGTTVVGNGIYIAAAYNLNDFSDYGITPSLSMATSLSYPPGQFTVNSPTETLVYSLSGTVVPEPASLSFVFLLSFGALSIRKLRLG